jgi:hypothetical protein
VPEPPKLSRKNKGGHVTRIVIPDNHVKLRGIVIERETGARGRKGHDIRRTDSRKELSWRHTGMNGDRVLFLDDEQNVLNSLRRLFIRDFDIIVSMSGPEALDLLKRGER